MKKIGLLLLLLLPVLGCAQSFVGEWGGTLKVGQQNLMLLFQIQEQDGEMRATLSSPDQGVKGVPVSKVEVKQEAICLEISPIKASFEGVLVSPKMIVGTFHQSGMNLPLLLTPHREKAKVRPQTPKPPFPYQEREVSFASRDNGLMLHGTLTLPVDKQPIAGVVMLTGTGVQNRDEEIFSHRPFGVIADYLTRRGVAVLRFDDRELCVEEEALKKKIASESTIENYTLDALGALDFLRSQPEMRGVKCGALGHSWGGTIALKAAVKDKHLAFVVSLAGSFLNGIDVLVAQNENAFSKMQLPYELNHHLCLYARESMQFIAAQPWKELKTRKNLYLMHMKNHPLSTKIPGKFRHQILKSYDIFVQLAWMHGFLKEDPKVDILRLKSRPLFALNGDKDTQVRAGEHLGRIQQLLPRSKHLKVKQYKDLNHLFQPCVTGQVDEYDKIETTFSEEVLQDIFAWIQSTTEK